MLFVPHMIGAKLILAIIQNFARFVSDAVMAYGKNVGMQDAVAPGRARGVLRHHGIRDPDRARSGGRRGEIIRLYP